ncbi:MAG: hypothetical protein OES32_07440 [Acidobacteriota bacterium]|nr:hypothetical protein [Acidobacteriota bacterium]
MRIFVAYHFDQDVEREPGEPSNQDLAGMVKDLIESHGMTAVSGEHVGGGQLEGAIRREIAASDGLVALCTADQKIDGGGARATKWVEDELGTARAAKKPCIGLFEAPVANDGLYEGYEYAPLERREPVSALIKLSHTLTRWKTSTARFQVLPAEIAELAGDPDVEIECHYQLWSKGVPGEWLRVHLEPGQRGTFATVDVGGPDDGVRFKVRYDGELWATKVTSQGTQVVFKRHGKR